MRPSRFSEHQMQQALVQVSAGTPLATMCRTLGITQTTFYRWRKKHGGAGIPGATESRRLRDENVKLKQVVADFYLEREMLRQSLAKYERAARR